MGDGFRVEVRERVLVNEVIFGVLDFRESRKVIE